MINRNYRQKDLKLLWAKSGGICAFDECKQDVILHKTNDIIGNISHIIAHSENGPRGDVNYSEELLNSYENLILLCPTHHSIVDTDYTNYSVDRLKDMKSKHEEWVRSRLSYGDPWKADISQLYYINIPRLAILAAIYGVEVDLSIIDKFYSLHSLGWELNQIMLVFKNLIEDINIKVNSIDSISELSDKYIGITVAFNHRFRTKNVPGLDDYNAGKFSMKGNISLDPHIYISINGFRVTLTIDPRWITTCTAFCSFRPSGGAGSFAGLCTIKQIDYDNKEIIATPLIIGIPKSPFDELLNGCFNGNL